MKLSKISIFCLVLAAVMTVGIIVVQAAGFVSYENNNKMNFWDNVRMANKGLKMSNLGTADAEVVSGGVVKILDKDIFVRGQLGFECADYPEKNDCTAAIGNIGNAFLTMDKVSSSTDLTLTSTHTNLTLNTISGASIIITGQLIIKGGKYLMATSIEPLPADSYCVYVTSISSNNLTDTSRINDDGKLTGLTMPIIRFDKVDEVESNPNHPIIFFPKRLIKIDLTSFTSP